MKLVIDNSHEKAIRATIMSSIGKSYTQLSATERDALIRAVLMKLGFMDADGKITIELLS